MTVIPGVVVSVPPGAATPPSLTQRRMWPIHGCESEFQPVEFSNLSEEAVILGLCQDLAHGENTVVGSLMAFQMVGQCFHLFNGEIPPPPLYEVRAPAQEILVIGELLSSLGDGPKVWIVGDVYGAIDCGFPLSEKHADCPLGLPSLTAIIIPPDCDFPIRTMTPARIPPNTESMTLAQTSGGSQVMMSPKSSQLEQRFGSEGDSHAGKRTAASDGLYHQVGDIGTS